MKKLLSILVLVTILSSCTDIRTEYSEIIHEKAIVVTLIYSPSEHHTELTHTAFPTMGDDEGMIGTDYNGNTGFRVNKNLQITSTTIPEKYGVVFQCQHGTFTIEGSEQKHEILYSKLLNNTRDTVEVLYKEQYTVTYEENKQTGKKEEVSRVLSDLDFIDAQVIKK